MSYREELKYKRCEGGAPRDPIIYTSEEELLNMFWALTLMSEDPQGVSRAFTKNGRKFAGTGAKKGNRVRTGFPFAAEAGQQKKNCHRTFLGMQTDEDAEDKANALCFALLRCFTYPPPPPAGVASPMAKGSATNTLKTRFFGIHRYIPLRSGVDLRCVLVGWQDKRPCATPSVRKEKECIGDARQGMRQRSGKFCQRC